MRRSEVVAESHTNVVREDIERITSIDLPWDHLRNSTILVAGASGMIPMYATRTLLHLNDLKDLNIKVKALVRNHDRAIEVFGNSVDRHDLQLIVGDVTDSSLDFGSFDNVIHGASAARPSEHARNPVATIRANITGTDSLLARHSEAEKRGAFLFMSSSEVYGSQPEGTLRIGEESYGGIDLLAPRSSYSEGKRAAETLVAVYAHQHGFEYRNLRFGHIYGPGMRLDDGRVQADFARDALYSRPIQLLSPGLAIRTYTYVADAVVGMFTAWLRGSDGAYNVADPAGNVTIRELALAFSEASDPPVTVTYPEDSSEQAEFNPEMILSLDSGKLESAGWSAHTSLAEGARRVVDHLREVHLAKLQQ